MKFVDRSGYGKKCLEISPSIHTSHNILTLIHATVLVKRQQTIYTDQPDLI